MELSGDESPSPAISHASSSSSKLKGNAPIIAWALPSEASQMPSTSTSQLPLTMNLITDNPSTTSIPLPSSSIPMPTRSFLPFTLDSRYRRLTHSSHPPVDDDRSDAATIGTSVAGTEFWEDEPEDENEVVGFEAVKRWTLRVNSAKPEDPRKLVVSVDKDRRSPSPPLAIDPAVLADLVETLEHPGDKESVRDFVDTYRGTNVVDAVYERIRVVKELREREFEGEENSRREREIGEEWEWEDMDRGGAGVRFREDAVGRLASPEHGYAVIPTAAEPVGTSDGLAFSDTADVPEGDDEESVASDWIVLEEEPLESTAVHTIKTLPKRALVSILIYSGNPNLLKTCRRLSRLPLPELGHQLAQLVVSFTKPPRPPPSKASTSDAPTLVPEPSSSSSVSSSESMQSFPTAVPYLPTDPAILLPRCARSACLNRSPLTLPYLARLLGPSFTPTADTLGAVLEIAARGRRWNTVRGALSLARIIQQRYFHPLHIHNDTLTRDTSPRVALLSADLDIQHRRRHFVPNGEDSFGSTRMLHISMVANVVANYGGQLDVGFFRDVVEDEGIDFPVDVIDHCEKHYALSNDIVEYLRDRFTTAEDPISDISARFARMGS